MPNINKIKLSGTSYDIQDANATKTVELTQAQYDALVTGGTVDSNTFYVITDGEMFNPSGKVDTSAFTEFSGAVETELSGKTDESAFTAHTGDSTIHVTTAQTAAWNAKSDFSGSYNDLTDKPTIPTVPTSNTAFTNDAGYITSNDITGKTDTTAFTAHTADTTIHVTAQDKTNWNAKSDFSGSYNDLTDKPTIPTVPTSNTAFTNDAGYITEDAISGKTNQSDFTAHTANTTVHVTANEKSTWNAKSDFSGSYNDLTNKLSAGTNITIVDNVISAEGGGKAVSGGTNISITTGETADTINCTVPASASSGNYSIMFGKPSSSGDASGSKTITGGQWSKAYAEGSVAIGQMNESRSPWAWAIGNGTSAAGQAAFACGEHNSTNNQAEFTCGYATITSGGSDTSLMTLFTVGNGTYQGGYQRHNALDIRRNGDIYIADTNDTSTSNYWEKPMIKLQDALGGGSTYTAGDGIDITNDVISVSGVSHNSLADGTKMLLRGDVTTNGQNYSNIRFDYYYGTSSNKNNITIKPLTINGESALRTAALSISVVETSAITTSVTSSSTDSQVPSAKAVNDKLGGLSLVKLTQSAYDALTTKDSNTLYVIVN